MYPTLYHAVHDLLALDIQVLKPLDTFGFLVALALSAAACCFAPELERRYGVGAVDSAPVALSVRRTTMNRADYIV